MVDRSIDQGKRGRSMLDKLIELANGMNLRFPEGNHPYEIMTRLLEECGEVASEVNHFENSGTKALRHGEASKEKLAGEIRDVLNALMQLALYYDVQDEVVNAVESSLQRLAEEGYIEKGACKNE